MEIMDAEDLEEKMDALAEHPENVGLNDAPRQRGTAGEELENGPDVDSEDPNLSAMMAEAGAEDRLNGLGMRDENEMRLEDPDRV